MIANGREELENGGYRGGRKIERRSPNRREEEERVKLGEQHVRGP
jgi:hypothetical protein